MSSLRLTRHAMLAAVAAFIAFTTAASSSLEAQASTSFAASAPVAATSMTARSGRDVRFGGGIALVGMQPLGEFKEFVSGGAGIQGHVLFALDESHVANIRLDLGFTNYGRVNRRVPLSSAYGDLIRIDLTTSNNVLFAGGGLQLMSPVGGVRPYVGGTAGVAYFWTQSSLGGDDETEGEGFARTTNAADATFAWSGTGGIYVPLGKAKSWGLDLGATYFNVGDASYMHEDSVYEVDGVPYVQPETRSRADMITYRIGVRFGR